MSRTQRSVLFDICCYVFDKAVPCPASELSLIFGDLTGWREYVDDLVAAGKLVRNEDGSIHNVRALKEAQKALELWKKKSEGGKLGSAKLIVAAYPRSQLRALPYQAAKPRLPTSLLRGVVALCSAQ